MCKTFFSESFMQLFFRKTVATMNASLARRKSQQSSHCIHLTLLGIIRKWWWWWWWWLPVVEPHFEIGDFYKYRNKRWVELELTTNLRHKAYKFLKYYVIWLRLSRPPKGAPFISFNFSLLSIDYGHQLLDDSSSLTAHENAAWHLLLDHFSGGCFLHALIRMILM